MMCSFNSELTICFFIFGVTIAQNNAIQQAIGFPEQEEDVNLTNKDNRQPVYIPAMCPPNELYYPGDQKDDWICDCRPAFLYHPKTDSCWAAYRKGPCPEGQYLVLPKDSVIAVCQKNPCNLDNKVMYNGRCETLNSMSACEKIWPQFATLTVNSTSLELTCEPISLHSRFGEVALEPCPPGCKRCVTGKCVPNSS